MPPKKGGAAAPMPKKETRTEAAEKVEAARMVTVLSYRGETYRIAVNNVPVSEKMAARNQAGIVWHDMLGETGLAPDITSVAVLSWLARRMAGEFNLPWRVFAADFPADLTISEVSSKQVPVEEVEGDLDPQP